MSLIDYTKQLEVFIHLWEAGLGISLKTYRPQTDQNLVIKTLFCDPLLWEDLDNSLNDPILQ